MINYLKIILLITLEFILIVYFLFEFFYTIGKCIAVKLEGEVAGNEI